MQEICQDGITSSDTLKCLSFDCKEKSLTQFTFYILQNVLDMVLHFRGIK